MNRKHFFTLTIIILIALALTVYNSKLLVTKAQTSNQTVLTITGLVQNPLNLNLSEIEAMPQITEYAVLFCVNAPTTPLEWGNWTGVQLSYLLQQAGVSSSAVKVAFFAPDGFTTDLPVQTAMQNGDIIEAYKLNNASISGLQQVVPNYYGYKWISDLTQIKLVNYNFLGTEESEGYPDDAVITGQSGSATLPSTTLPPESTGHPTQSPTPTTPSQSPLPTGKPTSPPTSSPKPQSTSTFLVYVATVSVIVVVFAVVLAATLIRRRKAKALKQEEAASAPSSQ